MDCKPPLILVCDDESHILHVVSLKLRNAGYEVATAANGQVGLDLAIELEPDLLITDFQMPKLTGVELVAELRQRAAFTNLPVLMLTARGFRLDPIELRRTTIAEVVSKPFSPRDLLAKVQTLVPMLDPSQAPTNDGQPGAEYA